MPVQPLTHSDLSRVESPCSCTHRLPTISPTVEEAQEASAIENALSTYADEMYYNFILGAEPLDRFDDYMAKLEELGLARALELKQDQLDRFNAR